MANEKTAIASLFYILFTPNPADLSLSSKDFASRLMCSLFR